MSIKSLLPWLAISLLVLATSCGGGGSSGSDNKITAVVQDLTVDPDGRAVVVTFKRAPKSLVPADFEADGGQTPTMVVPAGAVATVHFDARVTPSHRVRVVGRSGIDAKYFPVTTSNTAAPTFAITAAVQGVGLGNDTITVQFSGPRVVEALAEDLARWNLTVNGTAMDLTGSTFVLDVATQVLTITTGPDANLHAAFQLAAAGVTSVADVPLATTPVVGAATGDLIAPNLVSAVQDLAADAYGRVVNFTFDEAMDPVFSPLLPNFGGVAPDFATSATQTAATVLQVSFNNPMVPGLDVVNLTGLMDAHGNALAPVSPTVAQGLTAANAFNPSPVVTTVENSGNDFAELYFDQALDPDSALLPASWTLESPTGTSIDISGATFTYDLIARTLRVDLVQDLVTGDTFTLAPSLAPPLDVDGQAFADSFAGFVGGDAVPPSIVSATQNRNVDPTGATVDVLFSEDVDITSAFFDVPGFVINTTTLQAGLDTVRLVLAAAPVPGDDTLTATDVYDLAGTQSVPVAGVAIASSDTTPPSPIFSTVSAVEGAANDIVAVTFDDSMIPGEVTDFANWDFQSPVGTSIDLTGSAVNYNPNAKTARVTLAAGLNLRRGDGYSLSFTGMRDLGGNTVTSAVLSGSVAGEKNLPEVDAVWVETAFQNELHVRFTEPCDFMDDLAGFTDYTIRDGVGAIKGIPAAATPHADGMGVELVFGFTITAGVDTLDARGVTDLAGNAMFPAFDLVIEAEDATPPDFSIGSSLFVTTSGEENDQIQIVFDRRPSRWKLLDPARYAITVGGNPVSVTNESFSFDGVDTVTIDLDSSGAPGLQTGATYDVAIATLTSAQGVVNAGPLGDSLVAAGDNVAPGLGAGGARIDPVDATAVVIEFDEAVLPADAVNPANYDLNGGPNAIAAAQLGPRTVWAQFAATVTTTDTVNATMRDAAGIVGVVSQVAGNPDAVGPLVTAVSGNSVVNAGGDTVHVVFDEPVEGASALDSNNYTVTNGGNAVALGGAIMRYTSATNTVVLRLPAGVELDPTAGINVTVANVRDVSGNTMSPPAALAGAVSGDTLPPDFDASFVNFRESASGQTVDVRFDEDVDATFATMAGNWSSSGGQTVLSVEAFSTNHFRLFFDLSLLGGEILSTTGMPDVAGNTAGLLTTQPAF